MNADVLKEQSNSITREDESINNNQSSSSRSILAVNSETPDLTGEEECGTVKVDYSSGSSQSGSNEDVFNPGKFH